MGLSQSPEEQLVIDDMTQKRSNQNTAAKQRGGQKTKDN
jgi:hypothetical protein